MRELRPPSTSRVHAAAVPASPPNVEIAIFPSTTRSWLPARQIEARSCKQGDALVRPRPVADEVSEAPDLVEPTRIDLREHRFERVQVRVNVRDDGDSQRLSYEFRGGASGRSWIPRTVAYFDHESCIASSSSFANFVDMFTRETTIPGMSPSETSWSIRANVSVNS